MNQEFFRIQRTKNLQQNMGRSTNDNSETLLNSKGLQLKQLDRQLASSDSLNKINIAAIFLLEENLTTLQGTLEHAQNYVYSLKGKKTRLWSDSKDSRRNSRPKTNSWKPSRRRLSGWTHL